MMRTAWNPGNTGKLMLPSFYAEDMGDNWYESVVQYFLAIFLSRPSVPPQSRSCDHHHAHHQMVP
jgi:hypothetical protein